MLFTPDFGWVEVITGPMFSGKTTELLRRLDTCKWAKRPFLVFKPEIDGRYDGVKNHNGHGLEKNVISVKTDIEIYNKTYASLLLMDLDGVPVIAVDEANFFGNDLPSVLTALRRDGFRVIVAGLAETSEGKPFGPMGDVLAMADEITKVYGVCDMCGRPATRTQALFKKTEEIVVGGHNLYTCRCNEHWNPTQEE